MKSEETAALARVLRMVAEVEAEKALASPATGLPAHASSDQKKFAEIFRRLETLEARLTKLENPARSPYAR